MTNDACTVTCLTGGVPFAPRGRSTRATPPFSGRSAFWLAASEASCGPPAFDGSAVTDFSTYCTDADWSFFSGSITGTTISYFGALPLTAGATAIVGRPRLPSSIVPTSRAGIVRPMLLPWIVCTATPTRFPAVCRPRGLRYCPG